MIPAANRRSRAADPFRRRSLVMIAGLFAVPVASAATFTLEEATIADVRQAMDAGALSSVELTALYLNRIYAYDFNGIQLNSIPVMNPAALDEAAAADRLRAQRKTAGKPLLGVPFTVKDSYKVKGLTVAAGSPAFEYLIANEDAFTVAALRGAGGVLLGKTNMPPLAAGGMQRGVYGRAESPYNADYLTAAWNSGSSNGSGTSTAANLAMFGMGEETVSSGRSPSSNNALVAYTPSRGLISIRGNWPLYPIKDVVVPMTRTVADMLALLDVLMVEDPITQGDFWRDQKAVKLPSPASVRPRDFDDLKKPDALRGKRIGVPTMYIGKDDTGSNKIVVRPSVLALWEQAAKDLRAQGAEVVEVDFPLMHNYDEDRPGAQGFVARGLIPAEWAPGLRNGARAGDGGLEFNKLNPYSWEEFLQSCQDPKLPSWSAVDGKIVFPNPPGSVDYQQRPYRDYDKAKATIAAGVPPFASLPGLDAALNGLENIRKVDFEKWMVDNQLDFLVMPANADVGSAKADVDEAANQHATRNGTARSNTNAMMRHIGIPTVSVSMGILADIGMPVNLTFMGAAYSDKDLLSYAYAYEQATHRRRAPTRVQALADETIVYSAKTATPLSKRKETAPPTITLSGGASGPALQLSAAASDASAIASLRIYVNGHKVADGSNAKTVSAAVPAGDLQQWSAPGAVSVAVLVLAKDPWGNAAATLTHVAIPPIKTASAP